MATAKKTALERFDEAFIKDVIEAVKNNNAPWQKSWESGALSLPFNAANKTGYSGRNAIRLALQAEKKGYADPRWATAHQIMGMGGLINKGEKGTGILFYSEKIVDDEDGKDKAIPIIRHHHVFNIEQTNLPRLIKTIDSDREVLPDVEIFADLLAAHNPKMSIGEPSYRPLNDTIYIPEKASFHDDQSYYATVFHELGHWTGHDDRLNRNLRNKFGSPDYAKEELVAELNSYMLSLEFGLPHEPTQHEAYLKHWGEKTGKDLEESLLIGFKDATAAKNYLCEPLKDKLRALSTERIEKIYGDEGATPEQEAAGKDAPEAGKEAPKVEKPAGKETPEAEKTDIKDAPDTSENQTEGIALQVEQAPTKETVEVSAEDQAFWRNFYAQTDEKAIQDELKAEKVTYLAVAYEHRVEAKEQGARWDNDAKCWYAEDIEATLALKRFLPDRQARRSENGKTLYDFAQNAREIGLNMDNFNESQPQIGVWVRTPLINKPASNKDGSYKLFDNPDGTIGGIIKNLSSGESVTWSNRGADNIKQKPEVVRANMLNGEIHREVIEAARHKVQFMRGIDASIAYGKLKPIQGDEPYLRNKYMTVHNGMKRLDDGSLVIPLINGERVGLMADKKVGITSLQVIKPDGEKSIMRQTGKLGSYFPIGTKEARHNPSHVIIAEGIATADAVYQLMKTQIGDKLLVVAAVDSGNLKHVTEKMHAMYYGAEKFIAADNDIATEQKIGRNAGLLAAEEIAQDYPDLKIIAPRAINGKNTDWNDSFAENGANALNDYMPEYSAPPMKKPTLTIDTDGKCERDIGLAAFKAVNGDMGKIAEVQKALAKSGYTLDEKQLKGLPNSSLALRDAFTQAVKKNAKAADQQKKQVIER